MASRMPIAPWRPMPGVTGQNITIGAASVKATNALPAQCFAVQLSATGNCHVAIGGSPTAVATDMLIKGTDDPLIVAVTPGEFVAAIQDGASTGTLNVLPVTL